MVNVDEGGDDVDEEPDDGDQVGGDPHRDDSDHFVPPGWKMKIITTGFNESGKPVEQRALDLELKRASGPRN